MQGGATSGRSFLIHSRCADAYRESPRSRLTSSQTACHDSDLPPLLGLCSIPQIPNQHPWRSACLPRDTSLRPLRCLTPQSHPILRLRSVGTHPASGRISQISQRHAYHPSPYHPGSSTAHAKLAIARARRRKKRQGQEDHRRVCSRVRRTRRIAILWAEFNERGCDSSCG